MKSTVENNQTMEMNMLVTEKGITIYTQFASPLLQESSKIYIPLMT